MKLHRVIAMTAILATTLVSAPAVADQATASEILNRASLQRALEESPRVEQSQSGPATAHASAKGVSFSLPGGLALTAPQFTTLDSEENGLTLTSGNSASRLAGIRISEAEAQYVVAVGDDSAPTAYNFDVELPEKARLQQEPDGSVRAIDVDGQSLAVIATPWAHDAHGRAVKTRYSVSGTRLTQHVEHRSSKFVYPVLADPKVSVCKTRVKVPTRACVSFSKKETKKIAAKFGKSRAEAVGFLCAIIPTKKLKPKKLKLAAMAIKAACSVLLSREAANVSKVFKSAAKKKKCARVRFNLTVGPPPLFVVPAYNGVDVRNC